MTRIMPATYQHAAAYASSGSDTGLSAPGALYCQSEVPAWSGLTAGAACRPRGLQRNAVVGVLGGGQLGKMLGLEAVRTAAALPCTSVASRAESWLVKPLRYLSKPAQGA